MQKIGVIYNSGAGSNKRHPERKQKLQNILGNHGILRETRSKEDLDKAVAEFHQEKLDILAISGGDGTNQCVLTRFCEVYGQEPLPTILLLRGGTMNLRETSLKMHGTPEQRLQCMVALIEQGQYPVVQHTLLRVNNKYGFIFGNGLIANFMQEYYMGGDTGVNKILNLLAKIIGATFTGGRYINKLFQPIRATVQVGDHVLPEKEFTGLMAATERECGLGFKPFYRAREEQGKLHFLAFNLSPTELISNLHRVRMGKRLENETIYDIVTDRVVIKQFDSYTYTVDGEMLQTNQTIEVAGGPVVKVAAI